MSESTYVLIATFIACLPRTRAGSIHQEGEPGADDGLFRRLGLRVVPRGRARPPAPHARLSRDHRKLQGLERRHGRNGRKVSTGEVLLATGSSNGLQAELGAALRTCDTGEIPAGGAGASSPVGTTEGGHSHSAATAHITLSRGAAYYASDRIF